MEMFNESEYYDESFGELRFEEEKLEGVRFYDCVFTDCHFAGTAFRDCKFSGCSFVRCDLNGVRIADTAFAQASFTGSKLVGVNWTEADWPRIAVPGLLKFEGCTLNHATFIGLELPQCVFNGCLAKDVDFREANLAQADMRDTDFSESLFGDTDLRGADFSDAVNYQIDPGANRLSQAMFSLPEALSLLHHMDIRLNEE
ncbi:Pentapeptide repeat-containing protein [Paenibacillus sp. UNC496MF]|uniref:pentapeptide repeat-containing protein n=1 Tax=Paenibacillus sp. UNC496MF TaxID=1502753 RepID=UPI0008EE5C6C|nr:pentapeptide repeat-containing protein [Paenibacillus sp. UNC496MF]SFI36086.1 Pentapeptide repeat-containing protein [Paenibacillus sp. UNC496MF]